MLVRADGVHRDGWAMKDAKTGTILLSDICNDQDEAQALRREQQIHQPHRGHQHVVPVVITLVEGPTRA